MSQQQIEYLIGKINEFISSVYLKEVYRDLNPTAEQQDDDDWWNDVFIQTAVNSDEYNFQETWEEYRDTSPYEAFLIIEMINQINNWSEGQKWDFGVLTHSKIYKMYAYMYVMRYGIENWKDQIPLWDEEDDDDVCVCEEEEYNGTKDFPPNETDEKCPICLEEYDREIGRLQDGIQNSDYESNCPHWCCCMCWDKMYRQNKSEYHCPICKRDITCWLKTHYEDSESDSDSDSSLP